MNCTEKRRLNYLFKKGDLSHFVLFWRVAKLDSCVQKKKRKEKMRYCDKRPTLKRDITMHMFMHFYSFCLLRWSQTRLMASMSVCVSVCPSVCTQFPCHSDYSLILETSELKLTSLIFNRNVVC